MTERTVVCRRCAVSRLTVFSFASQDQFREREVFGCNPASTLFPPRCTVNLEAFTIQISFSWSLLLGRVLSNAIRRLWWKTAKEAIIMYVDSSSLKLERLTCRHIVFG